MGNQTNRANKLSIEQRIEQIEDKQNLILLKLNELIELFKRR